MESSKWNSIEEMKWKEHFNSRNNIYGNYKRIFYAIIYEHSITQNLLLH